MPNSREQIPLGDQPGCRKAIMDPQIKLFGQTIGVMSSHTDAGADAGVLKPTSASPPWDTAPSSSKDRGVSLLLGAENKGVVEKLISARSSSRDEFLQPPKSLELITEYGAPNVGVLCDDSKGAHSDDQLKDHSEGDHSHSVGDDKSLQKPEKVVSCPRCDSLDTKFCYFNNYNVNQPRHFCKNCQRYWTAGGTLRNVPVGAGRRKNKNGGLRDCAEASVNCSIQCDSGDSASQLLSCALGSPTSQKATSLKLSQPKRLTGQGSPMRSHGSTMSFGQDSGITMSSPYSLHQNGRLPFQSFSCSQGFMTSGTEVSAVGSSESASTLGQRLVRFPSGNGFDKDCNRSSLSGQMQDAANLLPRQTALNTPMLQLESSGMFSSVPSSATNGWAGSGAPVGLFNGEWPHGYHVDWDGKLPLPSSQGGASFSTPVIRKFNAGPAPPATSSWSPAPVPWVTTPWATTNVGHPQMTTSGWSGGQPMASSLRQRQPPVALHHTTLGKRGLSEGGRPEAASLWPAKALRIDDSKSLRSAWPILGRNQSEVNTSDSTLKLFHPKLELAGACEQKDSFVNRHFTTAAAARPVPFQVTI